jgi:hypothetical protein
MFQMTTDAKSRIAAKSHFSLLRIDYAEIDLSKEEIKPQQVHVNTSIQFGLAEDFRTSTGFLAL